MYWFILFTVSFLLTMHANAAEMLDRTHLYPTFADEFNEFHPRSDTQKSGIWNTHFAYDWAAPNDIRNRTLPNNKEEQLYIDPDFPGTTDKPLGITPFTIKDGVLHIQASTVDDPMLFFGYQYISGVITSKAVFSQQYGVFEMRAKLPEGRGLWPAFWLLPADGSWPPEIDVMEVLGHAPDELYTTLHWKQNGSHQKSNIPFHAVPDLSEAFHTYAVDWGPEEIIFYFDHQEIAREPTPPGMHQPFYILANLAVGGSWPGSPNFFTEFPAVMMIDWIRVHQRPQYAPR